MNPIKKKPEEVFDIYANEYNDWILSIKTYDDSLLFLNDSIKNESASILDLACGPGNISKFLLNNNSKHKITGVDLSPNMIKLAKQNNPTANFIVKDCRDLKGFNQKFDVIVCGFGLPYLTKPEALKLIDDCCNLLNPNGLIYLNTIVAEVYTAILETSSSGKYKTQMYYHEKSYLAKKLISSGLKIIFEKTYTTTNRKNEVVNDVVLIAKRS